MISHSVETPRGTGAFFLIPSVFFVSSPPDKVGYFPRAFDFFLNPSVLLYPTPPPPTPKNAMYEHRGRGLKSSLSPYADLAPRNAAGHGRGREFDT